jgi:hypothetical protein
MFMGKMCPGWTLFGRLISRDSWHTTEMCGMYARVILYLDLVICDVSVHDSVIILNNLLYPMFCIY